MNNLNQHLGDEIKRWGQELGFQQIGISDIDLSRAEQQLLDWLHQGFHGELDYMAKHGLKRSRPDYLVEGTVSVICARMNYLAQKCTDSKNVLQDPQKGYISRYALGRDYHKVLRQRLKKLANRIEQAVQPLGYRVFCDSAPVLEKPLAERAGLGWQGKHSNILSRDAGSWFFLGEIYVDIALPVDQPVTNHCGRCQACIEVCPTQAIVAPYVVDARRCISYLTIELQGSIPKDLRQGIGNRIYGCDDCQLFCPWNRFAQTTTEKDFSPRNRLDDSHLTELFMWSEKQFEGFTEGSAIRRVGYVRWLRNIAVALGNANYSEKAVVALKQRLDHESEIVREHVQWGLHQQLAK